MVTVPGKTHPVENLFLEDIFESTGHRISVGGEYAIRAQRGGGGGGRVQMTYSAGRGNSVTVNAEWEEGGVDGTGFNNWYHDRYFEGYKESTKASLRCVDEERINYDLVEDILHLIERSESSGEGEAESWEDQTDDDHDKRRDESKGGVLVFLPGLGEIMQLVDRLMATRRFSKREHYKIMAVHSSLSTEDQRMIFRKTPPGVRKIVLATNIAGMVPLCV